MIYVEIKDNDSVESALRRFKKYVEMEGILSEYKRHIRYKKPSEEKKERLASLKRKIYRRVKSSK